MNVPKLRFKNAEGADFPLWTMSKLGNEVQFSKGGKLGKSDLQKEGSHQCLLYGELYTSYGSIASKIFSRTDTDSDTTSQKYDVVMPTSGETAEDIATATCIPFDGILYGGDLIILRSQTLYGPFLSYQINSSLKRKISRVAQGKSVVHIGAEKIKPISFSFPCLEEQQKIASFFSTLDQKISIYERKLESLEQLKKGLMQKIFNQEIRFKSKEGKDYPCWKIAKLSEISQSLSYGLNASAAQFDGKNGYLRITDIDERTNKYISSTRVSPSCNPDKKYLLKEGDIVFARTGNSVGKTYIYKNTDGVLYYAGFLIRARLNPDVYPYFIFLQTLTNKYRKWVRIMSQRSGQPGINSEEYGNYKIVLPCLEEQEKIASVFRELDKKIDLSLAKIASLKKLKQGFMQQMFV